MNTIITRVEINSLRMFGLISWVLVRVIVREHNNNPTRNCLRCTGFISERGWLFGFLLGIRIWTYICLLWDTYVGRENTVGRIWCERVCARDWIVRVFLCERVYDLYIERSILFKIKLKYSFVLLRCDCCSDTPSMLTRKICSRLAACRAQHWRERVMLAMESFNLILKRVVVSPWYCSPSPLPT